MKLNDRHASEHTAGVMPDACAPGGRADGSVARVGCCGLLRVAVTMHDRVGALGSRCSDHVRMNLLHKLLHLLYQ